MAAKILVIDDDELVLMSVEGLLESEDFEVETASGGQEGLDKARQTDFDLIVTDIIMPKMSGFEVCKQLKSSETYKDKPVVMLTAKSAEADRKQGEEAGASAFLPKPIEPDKLIEVLRSLL